MDIYYYYLAFVIVQLIHSQEEIWTGFHKRWFVFKMPRWVFVTFELVFSAVIVSYALWPDLPFSSLVMPSFVLIMLINGIGHIVWGLIERRYVPGLVTAPFFIVLFTVYYFDIVGVF